MKWLLFCSAFVAYAVGTPVTQAAEPTVRGALPAGDAARGKEITQKWCAECHSTGPVAGDRAPTLAALAVDPKRTDAAVRNFLMQPHTPMPPLELEIQQIEDVIAYLHTVTPPPQAH